MEGTKKEINELLDSLDKHKNVPVVMPMRIKQEIKQEVEEDIFVVFEDTPMSRAANRYSASSNTGNGSMAQPLLIEDPHPAPIADLDNQPSELAARNREEKPAKAEVMENQWERLVIKAGMTAIIILSVYCLQLLHPINDL
ncbi:unnamed protein product [Caenorhabditis nigoni]